jgi:hypothetical protein
LPYAAEAGNPRTAAAVDLRHRSRSVAKEIIREPQGGEEASGAA